ncbi:guanine deaminase [Desulfoluna sp.]|uniref:guanine deaminase n=1 Tax=Desulfoluna sp. TaxID=2045199 RepID=UPI00261C3578|nr:guanine deaminase [Desulfoluna sp.]
MSHFKSSRSVIAVKGNILYFTEDPRIAGDKAWHYHPDGMLLIENGIIQFAGDRCDCPAHEEAVTTGYDYSGKLILPGFVDTHIHPPQLSIIASNSTELLHWLDTYTFPEEGRFADPEVCRRGAERYFDETLKNGTTTSLAMATVHAESAEALFREAEKRNLRFVTGKTLMDRNAPDFLTDTPESAFDESLSLIERWHGKGRLGYAVTPRFAVTSTPQQLDAAQALMKEADGLIMHTHLSENHEEIRTVRELFPKAENYLDVYDHFGLVGKGSLFAHAIHLSEGEYERLADSGAAVSFCPSSNLFLGSGLFRMDNAERHSISVGLGSDVGGGTSFSQLYTMAEGFKVCQLCRTPLAATTAFYLATLGGARSLGLETRIGSFQKGSEADFLVLDPEATPLAARRTTRTESLEERLFVLMILGDDRFITATHIMGKPAYTRSEERL